MSEANETGIFRGRAIATQPDFRDKLGTPLDGVSLE
jgi:hypothetical protein